MSTEYNYRDAVENDVTQYIEDNINLDEFRSRDELEEYLQDALWVCDEVTGNASGSYTFNAWRAEENLCHNWDILEEALSEFCDTFDPSRGAEYYDVTIRCYLLGEAIAKALDHTDHIFNEGDD